MVITPYHIIWWWIIIWCHAELQMSLCRHEISERDDLKVLSKSFKSFKSFCSFWEVVFNFATVRTVKSNAEHKMFLLERKITSHPAVSVLSCVKWKKCTSIFILADKIIKIVFALHTHDAWNAFLTKPTNRSYQWSVLYFQAHFCYTFGDDPFMSSISHCARQRIFQIFGSFTQK